MHKDKNEIRKNCTIAIPVWNKWDITKNCLESVFANTLHPYNVIIIDNGSDKETADNLAEFCRTHAGFEVKKFESNLGYLEAANFALSTNASPYLCLLNNDTIVTKGWLSECINIAEACSDIGVVSPTTNEIGHIFEDRFNNGKIAGFAGTRVEMNSGLGSCFIIKKEVIEKIGIFDAVYGQGYFEEVDYCLRAKNAGYISVLALGAFIKHISGASFNEIPEKAKSLWAKNRDILESRWGRSTRVLFYISKSYDTKSWDPIKAYLLELCRKKAIIDLYFKRDIPGIKYLHFNIRPRKIVIFNRIFLLLALRLKKKSYDSVVTDCAFPEFLKKFVKVNMVNLNI